MGESNTHAGNKDSKVQCIEILVSKISLERSGNNLPWTLSVYSLENQPIKKNLTEDCCESFHFMVYDWKRTIKRLLNDLKIPYSVTQYFALNTIYREAKPKFYFPGDATVLFESNKMLTDADYEVRNFSRRSLADRSPDERTDFILDETNA